MNVLKEKILVYCDAYSCFIVDTLEGLPPFPNAIEQEIQKFGEEKWNEMLNKEWTQWKFEILDVETNKLYDKYGTKKTIIPKITKRSHRGYLTAAIQWYMK